MILINADDSVAEGRSVGGQGPRQEVVADLAVDRLLSRAAFLCTPERYNRNSNEVAIEPFSTKFHLSSLLERANLKARSGHIPRRGDPELVIEAKRRICLHLQVPHVCVWEWAAKPNWREARAALQGAQS